MKSFSKAKLYFLPTYSFNHLPPTPKFAFLGFVSSRKARFKAKTSMAGPCSTPSYIDLDILLYFSHTLNTFQHLKRIINVYGNTTKSVPIKIPESETRFTPHHVTGKQKICKMANKRKSKSVRVMMKNELNETRQQIQQQHL